MYDHSATMALLNGMLTGFYSQGKGFVQAVCKFDIWTTVTLFLGVCHVSIFTNCKVFRIPLLVLLQTIEGMLMLHPF